MALGHNVRSCSYGLQEAQSTVHQNKLSHGERKHSARVPMQPRTIKCKTTHHPRRAGSACEVNALSEQAIDNVPTGCRKRDKSCQCVQHVSCETLYHAGSNITLLKCNYGKYKLLISPALNRATRRRITVIVALDET